MSLQLFNEAMSLACRCGNPLDTSLSHSPVTCHSVMLAESLAALRTEQAIWFDEFDRLRIAYKVGVMRYTETPMESPAYSLYRQQMRDAEIALCDHARKRPQ